MGKTQPREPTPLSAVFRRLAKEEPVLEPAGGLQFEGFGEAQAAELESRPAPPPARKTPPDPSPAARGPPSREAPIRARRRDPPSDPATPASRQTLRRRVRDWLGDAPPAFESLAEPIAQTGPVPQARPAGAPVASNAAPGRPAPPSMPRNRRLYRRVQLPAEIEIAGAPCTLIDLSIGGFAATGVPPLEPNSHVPVTIRLTIDRIEVGTQLNARIIYVSQGRSSGRFVELSASQTAFLRYLVTWRGESVGAVGTTTLLDAITGGPARDLDARFGPPPRGHWWSGRGRRKAKQPR
ncbi:MAG TPA: hypothetical protein VFC56_17885 [Stellaceae bacterium]|nr:hypothetical protein [Stellaceae bacterium]